ncbi:hypothetical protein [Lichenifustis flavocetrariae]|uniref:Uncharacterized protein n=1 Tax=Lichenifustis flavocetrariae TaxID=2949735 RepID=A0AA42CRH3_9HYPH|nr:hypothetical protein [Lichenifustis flavocetrariae]MCW6512497.1 hypothetical protein [Lichenifustis flavocetrariae]
MQQHNHAVVWINQHEAKVFLFSAEDMDKAVLLVTYAADGAAWKLTISDNGVGKASQTGNLGSGLGGHDRRFARSAVGSHHGCAEREKRRQRVDRLADLQGAFATSSMNRNTTDHMEAVERSSILVQAKDVEAKSERIDV